MGCCAGQPQFTLAELVSQIYKESSIITTETQDFLLKNVRLTAVESVKYNEKQSVSKHAFLREIFALKVLENELLYLKGFYVVTSLYQIYTPLLESSISTDVAIKQNPLQFITETSTQIAKIHKCGFVWDDPKIENIIFNQNQFKVIDFDAASPIGTVWEANVRGSAGHYWSCGESCCYFDFIKFAFIIQTYSKRLNIAGAQQILDAGYIDLLDTGDDIEEKYN